MEFYVYAHRRNDTGKIFYIGKGCGKRAWKKSCRSDWWKRIEAKHGRSVEIISRRLPESDAFELEHLIIEEIGIGNLCNLRGGGLGGISPSDETRKKMSAAQKGRKHSPESIEKMRIRSAGFRHSEETKKKLSEINRGRTGSRHTPESRAAISRAKKGQIRTPEHCAAISEAKKGVSNGPMRDKLRAILLAAHTGRKHSEESKRKMSEASTGKKHAPEVIARMTESNQRLNAARRKPITCSNGMTFDFSGSAEEWLRSSGYPSAGRANIVSCCTGKLKTAYGLTWQYA